MLFGISHDAQLEFQQSDGTFDYLYALKIFTSWLVLITVISYFLLAVLARFVLKSHIGSTLSTGDDTSASSRSNDHIGDEVGKPIA